MKMPSTTVEAVLKHSFNFQTSLKLGYLNKRASCLLALRFSL